MFKVHLKTLVYVFLSCYTGVKCIYWGFAGIQVDGSTISADGSDVSMVINNESLVTCIFQCTYSQECLIVSYQTTTLTCIGYKRTNLIGPFKPEDPDVNPPTDYISLFFNYNYANSLGFVSNLQTGTSYRVSDVRLTKTEAEAECQKWNAHLITLMYPSQINELKEIVNAHPLLGSGSFVFVAGQGGRYNYYYPNGESVPSIFWMVQEPSTMRGCVVLSTFGLRSHSCTDSLYFICSLL